MKKQIERQELKVRRRKMLKAGNGRKVEKKYEETQKVEKKC